MRPTTEWEAVEYWLAGGPPNSPRLGERPQTGRSYRSYLQDTVGLLRRRCALGPPLRSMGEVGELLQTDLFAQLLGEVLELDTELRGLGPVAPYR
jgi:hypothetical protein